MRKIHASEMYLKNESELITIFVCSREFSQRTCVREAYLRDNGREERNLSS